MENDRQIPTAIKYRFQIANFTVPKLIFYIFLHLKSLVHLFIYLPVHLCSASFCKAFSVCITCSSSSIIDLCVVAILVCDD
jgi:hypothetical protein